MVRNRYAVLALAATAMFISVVDFTIVNVSLPRMAADLKLGEDSLQWVIIGYGLPFGGLLLLAGRLGDIFGRRLTLQIGLATFATGSLTAGLAGSAGQLIAGRVVQGIGAALITPSALGIVADAFKEGKEREAALGIYGAIAGTAASVGVLAGGFLTDGPGWSWIFYVNIPIAVALLASTIVVLPQNLIAHPKGRLDPRSALAVTGGLVAGLYAINHGVVHGWGTSGTLIWGAVGLTLLLAFGASESRTKVPLVPRSLLGNGPVVQANLAAAAGFGSFIAFVFLTSVMMQQLLGYSPTKTGLAWLFTTVVAFFFAGATGAVLAQKLGARVLLGAASVLIIGAATWLAFLPAHPSLGHVIPALVAGGMAVGFFAPSVQIGALTDVAETDFGAASGAVETSRELGGAVVIAAASSVLLGSHTGLLHGMHSGYVVIAIGGGIGLLATLLPLKPRRIPVSGYAAAAPAPQRTAS
jgi:EmrB/QacA subfamily drug resistance transporter